ncbi:traP domain protein [Bacteroides ovatus str. 3725 D1 iv]|nr:traP domain protein [Bacteroides ovatus str. 3725 D1 iv]
MLSEGCRLRIFSHGWGMSLSEGAVTSCGILPRTGASAHPLSV